MSRLGKTPIQLPKGVEVKINQRKLHVKGSKGTMELDFPEGIEISVNGTEVAVAWNEASGLEQPAHGLYRSLVNNIITGVSRGFEKKLSLVGVGYRAAVQGKSLEMQLGFSHPCLIPIPQGIEIAIEKSVAITITGIDKALVGQFAASVRALRPPEPYKGKGVRYIDEFVRKKAGKSAKGK
ncbi:MAG: 50S ribosomal protein L6 [Simkaniaceae bacterium]|nr:50S ribosomal protein L6 [Simkaniaceae bacterium]